MVQKTPARPRGRPPAYDREEALARATQAFWRAGYSGTSLDQLSDAMDMNRPSLYAAFGDKRSLYLQTLARYTQRSDAAIEAVLDRERPLEDVLRRFYLQALQSYLPAGEAALGCYLIGTATTESVGDPEIRTVLNNALRGFERAIASRLRHAQQQGELDAAAEPDALAAIASSVLHTLAVRSRAGESRAALTAVAETAVRLICGTSQSRSRRPARARKTRVQSHTKR